jgi:hypothetical protein
VEVKHETCKKISGIAIITGLYNVIVYCLPKVRKIGIYFSAGVAGWISPENADTLKSLQYMFRVFVRAKIIQR